ncbi:MAG TPA: hypothetical protein VHW95_15360 [Steroidobacteraceae bacterium]|jgi:hypothetical protein|nr:hypothetical protein [Steroidobacteraceae bacterium]
MNKPSVTLALIMAAAAMMSTTAIRPAMAVIRDEDMVRCAAISAREARLDCFDALARQLSNKAAPATPSVASASVTPQTSAPAAVSAADPKNFGLTAAQQHTTDLGPNMISANIANLSSDQTGATLVVLDNGEIWSVAHNDGWLASGQAVRIRKASAGAFLMFIPSNHSYHVRRLK